MDAVAFIGDVGMTGHVIRLPKGTKLSDGKIKLPDPDLKRSKPQAYAAKNKRKWRAVK